jgi:glycosyltransferase involved in cell wall biosynthesis
MKLLVFAHTPPPHHGQSYMVQLMLAGFGGDQRRSARPAHAPSLGIECYHVNARVSRKLGDIGELQVGKILLLLGYCLQAVWCRFRYRVTTLYYIPAPGKRSALYRDWLVMFLCRPFFKRIVLHWHCAGLAEWLETAVQMRFRSLTYRLMKKVDLSIVLSRSSFADAQKLFSRRVVIVRNGIPDPCPAFDRDVLPRRRARLSARQNLLAGRTLTPADLAAAGGDPQVFKVLYLAHCIREKGLFDTLDGVALANHNLALAQSPLRIRLSVAGDFMKASEREEFRQRLAQPDLRLPGAETSPETAPNPDYPSDLQSACRGTCVTYLGFVSGPAKTRALAESDCFCFPTSLGENFPLVVLEAMAFGLPILTTRWRATPEVLPQDYPGFVDIRSPGQIADRLQGLLCLGTGEELRELFIRSYTLEHHLAELAQAIRSTETGQ